MRTKELPSGWINESLSDIAGSITSGATPQSGSSRYYTGAEGIKFAKIDDLTAAKGRHVDETILHVTPAALRETALRVYPIGTLLLSMYGTIGLVKTTSSEMSANQALAALLPPFKCHSDYLAHALIWSRPKWERFKSQTTQANINGRIVKAFRLDIPTLPEQRRIAEILDTLDEAIRKTEKVIAKLQQMKQGLLHDLLTRGIDENGELRDPERHPEKFKDSPLGRIPKGWKLQRLAEVAEIRSGIAKNSNKAVNNPIWVHYLRVANVQDGYLDLSQMSQIRVSPEDLERYSVECGDVLMNEGGDLDKLGRGGIWRGEFSPCIHQNHVFVVRCGSDLLPELLDAWTGSPAARRYFMTAGKQTTNLASINKTALGLLPVVVPPPSEQRLIVDALRLHDERSDLEASSLAKLYRLKRGLMNDLLTGRVRIPHESEADAE